MHLVKVLVVCQRVESFAVVAALYLREYTFDAVKFRAVADILDLFDVNLVVKVLD
jgi:16S rRNA G527 N7-methylase RsmG